MDTTVWGGGHALEPRASQGAEDLRMGALGTCLEMGSAMRSFIFALAVAISSSAYALSPGPTHIVAAPTAPRTPAPEREHDALATELAGGVTHAA